MTTAPALLRASTPALRRHGLLVLLLLLIGASGVAAQGGGVVPPRRRRQVVDVGVILDTKTWVGNMSWTCMELALDDFYADDSHARYLTRLKLHLRDTGPNAVDAAAAGTCVRAAPPCSTRSNIN